MNTKEEVLRVLYDCRNQWQWLEITGDTDKTSYAPSKDWEYGCACCEYVKPKEYSYDTCGNCPLIDYVFPFSITHNNLYFGHFYFNCVERNSPFDQWVITVYISDIKDFDEDDEEEMLRLRREYAHQIVVGCNRAIEDILTK